MEDLTLYHTKLEKLRDQAMRLTSDVVSLVKFFAEEASHLNRMDEASQLVALRSSILRQLHRERSREDDGSYAHNKATITILAGRLAAGIPIKMLSRDKQLPAFSDLLLKNLPDKQPPFGNVLVYIGPKGIPDEVQVVSISEMARKENRQESEIVDELGEHGCLLFDEKAFSLLMDKLINDVQEGRLSLPVSQKELPEL